MAEIKPDAHEQGEVGDRKRGVEVVEGFGRLVSIVDILARLAVADYRGKIKEGLPLRTDR